MTQENQIKPAAPEDREAAARLTEWIREHLPEVRLHSDFEAGIRRGIRDEHYFVQAFARHCLNTRISPGETATTEWRALLEEAAGRFREYELHHLNRVEAQRLGHNPLAIPERQAKADRNAELAERIERALSPPAPTAPSGEAGEQNPELRLCPREPTAEMIYAGKQAFNEWVQDMLTDDQAGHVWRAMYDAALSSTPSNIRDQAIEECAKVAWDYAMTANGGAFDASSLIRALKAQPAEGAE